MIAPAIRKIADQLQALADEIEAGHVIASDDLRLQSRRIEAQAEMLDEGIAE